MLITLPKEQIIFQVLFQNKNIANFSHQIWVCPLNLCGMEDGSRNPTLTSNETNISHILNLLTHKN